MTPIEANKALVRRYIEEGLNAGNREVIVGLLAPEAMSHGPGPFHAVAAVANPIEAEAMASLIPPLIIEDMVAEGNTVVTRATRGPLFAPRTDRLRRRAEAANQLPITLRTPRRSTTVFFHRIEGGRIAEEWIVEGVRPIGSHY